MAASSSSAVKACKSPTGAAGNRPNFCGCSHCGLRDLLSRRVAILVLCTVPGRNGARALGGASSARHRLPSAGSHVRRRQVASTRAPIVPPCPMGQARAAAASRHRLTAPRHLARLQRLLLPRLPRQVSVQSIRIAPVMCACHALYLKHCASIHCMLLVHDGGECAWLAPHLHSNFPSTGAPIRPLQLCRRRRPLWFPRFSVRRAQSLPRSQRRQADLRSTQRGRGVMRKLNSGRRAALVLSSWVRRAKCCVRDAC